MEANSNRLTNTIKTRIVFVRNLQ